MIEVFIPWVGPSLNVIWAGMHWAKRKKIADEGHLACLVARKLVLPWECVRLEFEPQICKGRLYDCTNYALTAKVIEDGLVSVGVLQGDTAKHVARVTLCQPQRTKGESGMIVRFIEA